MEYYLLSAVFGLAFSLETMVTGKLFLSRHHVELPFFARWWAVLSLGAISVSNVAGFMRVYQNYHGPGIDDGNYVQAFMALSAASLLGWVWWFHNTRWGPRHE